MTPSKRGAKTPARYLPELDEALARLVDFKPRPHTCGAHMEGQDGDRDELIQLASTFVAALEETPEGFGILEAQVADVLNAMKKDAPIWECLQQAMEVLLKRLNPKGEKPSVNWLTSNVRAATMTVFEECQGTTAFPSKFGKVVLGIANESLRNSRILRLRDHATFERLHEEAWKIMRLVDKAQFLGSWILLECRASSEDYQRQRNLLECCAEIEKAASAVQKTADGLCKALEQKGLKERQASHDFRSYRSFKWSGEAYHFSDGQARIIQLLDEAYCRGTPEVGACELLAQAELDSKRLHDVFKYHATWKKLIVRGKTKGSYRLKEPSQARSRGPTRGRKPTR